ncbi:MAG: acetyl-CoA carboxylase biotin carboxyl carrier protein subunit, partial [Myxococcales bacterium]|nr:acetyl-CoA carboxylase biotin carboxyl carrier protein subunit [Myxococcales bacterium]
EAALAAALSAGAGAGAGASKITAPMPGRVVKILVAAGEAVEQGAPVIIVEAMKMENEMYAPGAGVVRTIAVAEGDTVDGGQLLCEFDLNA